MENFHLYSETPSKSLGSIYFIRLTNLIMHSNESWIPSLLQSSFYLFTFLRSLFPQERNPRHLWNSNLLFPCDIHPESKGLSKSFQETESKDKIKSSSHENYFSSNGGLAWQICNVNSFN